MARRPRVAVPAYPHHILQRGNNRQAIFCTEDDYCFSVAALQQAKSTICGVRLAFSLASLQVRVRCQRPYEDQAWQCTMLLSRARVASLCISDCWGNCKEHVASIESRWELTRRYSLGHRRRGLRPICHSFRTSAMVGGAVAQSLGPREINRPACSCGSVGQFCHQQRSPQ